MNKPVIYHIPVCPFSQRIEILLELKGMRSAVEFRMVDITRPREASLVALGRGNSALPLMVLEDGAVLRESVVLLRYLEDRVPAPPVLQHDAYRRAVENMLVAMEGDFTNAGYRLLMSQDPDTRAALQQAMLAQYARLDGFLCQHNVQGTWLFDDFGFAEAVFAPMFMRFWLLEYYEQWDVPDTPQFARIRRWRDACRTHPASAQVTREEIIKLYADYAKGAGNGALLPGRTVSSFALTPHWSQRPWPPADKYQCTPSDAELGLL